MPQHYKRELRQRLENLRQGSMIAEETYNAMQVAMVRANVMEDEETTMARYLRVLNYSLSTDVDMFSYSTMTQLLHLAMKVERKNKNRYQGTNMDNRWRSSTSGQPAMPDAQSKEARIATSTPGAHAEVKTLRPLL